MALTIQQPYDVRDYIEANVPSDVKDLNKWDVPGLVRNEIIAMTRSVVAGGKNYLSNKIPFASSFGVNVNTYITFELQAPMAVNVSMGARALTPRLNLFVNPFWLLYKQGILGDKFIDDESFEDVAAMLLHEYMHLLYDHHGKYKFYMQRGLAQHVNIATDTQINQDPMIVANKRLMEYGITLESTRQLTKDPSLKAKMNSEYYFDAIMKHVKQDPNTCPKCGKAQIQGNQSDQQDQQSQSGQDQGQQGQSDQNGQGQTEDVQEQSNKDQSDQGNQQGQGQFGGDSGDAHDQGGSHGKGDNCCQHCGSKMGQGQGSGKPGGDVMGQQASHEAWNKTPSDVADEAGNESATADASEQAIADAVKNASELSGESIESLKSRGLVSAHIVDRIMKGTGEKGKLPIKAVLMKGTGRLKMSERKTFRKVNPHQGNRVDIRRGKVWDNAKNIRTFIDNSGSMGASEINWAMNEISSVAKRAKARLEVIPFDTVVYDKNKQYAEKSGKWSFTPVGRGGTAFQPVFDWLNDHNANNRDDLIIIITDGYGERRVNTYGLRNVIWLLVEEKRNTLSVDNPVGQVAWLDQDDKYRLHKLNED